MPGEGVFPPAARLCCLLCTVHYALGAGAGIEARLFTGHEVEHASGTPRFCRPADGDKMDGDGNSAYCEVTCSAVYTIATCAGPFLCVQERVQWQVSYPYVGYMIAKRDPRWGRRDRACSNDKGSATEIMGSSYIDIGSPAAAFFHAVTPTQSKHVSPHIVNLAASVLPIATFLLGPLSSCQTRGC